MQKLWNAIVCSSLLLSMPIISAADGSAVDHNQALHTDTIHKAKHGPYVPPNRRPPPKHKTISDDKATKALINPNEDKQPSSASPPPS